MAWTKTERKKLRYSALFLRIGPCFGGAFIVISYCQLRNSCRGTPDGTTNREVYEALAAKFNSVTFAITGSCAREVTVRGADLQRMTRELKAAGFQVLGDARLLKVRRVAK